VASLATKKDKSYYHSHGESKSSHNYRKMLSIGTMVRKDILKRNVGPKKDSKLKKSMKGL